MNKSNPVMRIMSKVLSFLFQNKKADRIKLNNENYNKAPKENYYCRHSSGYTKQPHDIKRAKNRKRKKLAKLSKLRNR